MCALLNDGRSFFNSLSRWQFELKYVKLKLATFIYEISKENSGCKTSIPLLIGEYSKALSVPNYSVRKRHVALKLGS